jgi:hypothetical protein
MMKRGYAKLQPDQSLSKLGTKHKEFAKDSLLEKSLV